MTQKSLKDTFLRTLKCRAGKSKDAHYDPTCPGLAIRVTASGRKTWTFDFGPATKRARITLGTYPATSLETAKDLAIAARGQVEAGKDPRDVAAEVPDKTIADLIDDRIRLEVRADADNYLRSCMEVERCYDKDVIPPVGKLLVKDFKIRHLNLVLDPIKARGKNAQANRVFEHVRALFSFAVKRGEIEFSPIDKAEAPCVENVKNRWLTLAEIRKLWGILTAPPSITCRAGNNPPILRMILATAQRPGEVAGIHRKEIDLAKRVWTIPAARSKNGHEHLVPLNDLAMMIVQEQMRQTNGDFLFPNEAGDGPTPNYTVAGTLARAVNPDLEEGLPLGRWGIVKFTAHDLRRTVATHMSLEENGLQIEALYISHVLNHRSVTKSSITSRVYNQNTYLREKRDALDKWGAFLAKLVGVEIEQREAA